MKPLDIATPALVRVRGEGRTFLALWRDKRLWDLNPLTLDALLRLPLDGIRAGLGAIIGPELDLAQVELAAPAESQEVWAAGVTYLRSREARLEEATQKTVYEHVYESDRPELFFKAAGWRVVPDGGEVGVREDSTWDVPEPELAVLSNAHGEVVAFAIGNAVTGNIWALFVRPEYEGRGHGRQLHDTMVSWLWAAGLDRLWLTTEPGTRAQRFYEVAGWRLTGTTERGELRYELPRR